MPRLLAESWQREEDLVGRKMKAEMNKSDHLTSDLHIRLQGS